MTNIARSPPTPRADSPRETIIATLPFAGTPKRPKGPDGRYREGIWQSARRNRPLALTDQRLFVFDAARTPLPRFVLAEFPLDEVQLVKIATRSFGNHTVHLELAGVGEVPFELGRYDEDGLTVLTRTLESDDRLTRAS